MADEFTKVEDIKNNPFLNKESSINVSEPEKFTKVEDIQAGNSFLKNSRPTEALKSQQPTQREEKVEVEKSIFGSSYIRRDEKGNVSSRREYSGANQFTGEYRYSYDEQGRVVSEEEFDRHEMPSGSRKYAYDENGQKYETRYDKDGRMTSQRKYDKDGREQSFVAFNDDGKIERAVSYAYRESGKVAQETVYEMTDGKMLVAEQAFYDDDENKHSRVIDKDGAVNLKTQARGASMPSAVNDVTQHDIAYLALSEAEVAKWHQKYLDEVAFYDDKPAPSVDPWIAMFGENGQKAPAKEAARESDANANRYVDDKGYEHTVTRDDAGRIVSDKKYDKDGTMLGEGFYKYGEPAGRNEYFTDDKGVRHTVAYDAENKILSDRGIDENGKLVGESLFENGEFVGSKKYAKDDMGFDHVITRDENNTVLSDKKYDENGTLLGEGLYKNGEPLGRKEYRMDDKGLRHTITYDAENRILSDQGFDEDGTLRGESLFENGEFVGSKEYATEYAKGGQTFDHIITRDADNKVLSDKRYDKDGALLGEGLYKNGEFVGSKEYAKDDMGFDHVITRNADNEIVSEQKFDKNGQLMTEAKTVQNDVKTSEPERKPAARAATENLPSVRGNAMPERARAETSAERGNVDPNLPSVRGNSMPERDKTAGYENAVADSFVKLSAHNSQGNVQALFNDMQNLMQDYRSQGLTAKDIQQKMQSVMASAYDKGVAQGLSADLLKNNIARFSEGFNKEAEREAAEQSAAAMPAVARDGKPDFSDAEYVDYEEVPAEENAAGAADARVDEGNEANTVEAGANEAKAAPANAKADDERVDEGNEANAPEADVNDARADEGNESKAAAVNVNDGYDNGGNGVVPPAGNGNDGNADGLADGGFTMSADDGYGNTNGNANAGKADSGDLLAQMMDTAFKNRYMMVEDVNNDPNHLCPFGQLKSNTVKDKSDDKDDPRVSMQLNSGATLVNRPNRVHIKYTTKVDYDDNGNEVRSPQVSFEDCMAAVRVGMEKGWTSATLNGPDAYKEQMYLAMRAMGMKVVGYQPSAELQKQGDELAAQYVADRRHADFTDQRYPAISAQCKADGLSKPEKIGESFVNKMNDMDGMRYDPAEEEVKLTKDGNYTVTTSQNDGEGNTTKSTVTYGFGGRVLPNAKEDKVDENDGKSDEKDDKADEKDGKSDEKDGKADENDGKTEENDGKSDEKDGKADEKDGKADENDGKADEKDGKTEEQPQPVNENGEERPHVEPPHIIKGNGEGMPLDRPNKEAENTTLPAVIDKDANTNTVETPNLPATIDKGGKANEVPEQVPPVKGAENNLPVPVTAKVKTQLALEAAGATTALAKTDPVMARQMATQVATTKGIANQLQVVGQIANQAKGNNTQLALTQHRQQETAIVLASQKGKTK